MNVIEGSPVSESPERSFWRPILAMQDALSAYVRSVEANYDISGIFNIATGKESSVLDIFNKLEKNIGKSVKKVHTNFPSIGFQRGCLSIKKAEKIIGWQPKNSLDQGLAKTINWFKNDEKNS